MRHTAGSDAPADAALAAPPAAAAASLAPALDSSAGSSAHVVEHAGEGGVPNTTISADANTGERSNTHADAHVGAALMEQARVEAEPNGQTLLHDGEGQAEDEAGDSADVDADADGLGADGEPELLSISTCLFPTDVGDGEQPFSLGQLFAGVIGGGFAPGLEEAVSSGMNTGMMPPLDPGLNPGLGGIDVESSSTPPTRLTSASLLGAEIE